MLKNFTTTDTGLEIFCTFSIRNSSKILCNKASNWINACVSKAPIAFHCNYCLGDLMTLNILTDPFYKLQLLSCSTGYFLAFYAILAGKRIISYQISLSLVEK